MACQIRQREITHGPIYARAEIEMELDQPQTFIDVSSHFFPANIWTLKSLEGKTICFKTSGPATREEIARIMDIAIAKLQKQFPGCHIEQKETIVMRPLDSQEAKEESETDPTQPLSLSQERAAAS